MEAKLRAMESRLRLDGGSGSPAATADRADGDTVGFSFKVGPAALCALVCCLCIGGLLFRGGLLWACGKAASGAGRALLFALVWCLCLGGQAASVGWAC